MRDWIGIGIGNGIQNEGWSVYRPLEPPAVAMFGGELQKLGRLRRIESVDCKQKGRQRKLRCRPWFFQDKAEYLALSIP